MATRCRRPARKLAIYDLGHHADQQASHGHATGGRHGRNAPHDHAVGHSPCWAKRPRPPGNFDLSVGSAVKLLSSVLPQPGRRVWACGGIKRRDQCQVSKRTKLAPRLAPNALAQAGIERDGGSSREAEGRRIPHSLVRVGIGRDGTERISRPPRSTAPAPLRNSSIRSAPRTRRVATPMVATHRHSLLPIYFASARHKVRALTCRRPDNGGKAPRRPSCGDVQSLSLTSGETAFAQTFAGSSFAGGAAHRHRRVQGRGLLTSKEEPWESS